MSLDFLWAREILFTVREGPKSERQFVSGPLIDSCAGALVNLYRAWISGLEPTAARVQQELRRAKAVWPPGIFKANEFGILKRRTEGERWMTLRGERL